MAILYRYELGRIALINNIRKIKSTQADEEVVQCDIQSGLKLIRTTPCTLLRVTEAPEERLHIQIHPVEPPMSCFAVTFPDRVPRILVRLQ